MDDNLIPAAKAMQTPAELMRVEMAKDWEAYHWVFETNSLEDLAALIERKGSVEEALKWAREHTELMNEMQSNCY